MVHSRAFSLGGREVVMVPFMDAINHRHDNNVNCHLPPATCPRRNSGPVGVGGVTGGVEAGGNEERGGGDSGEEEDTEGGGSGGVVWATLQ